MLKPTYQIIKDPDDISAEIKEVTTLFSVPVDQLDKTITRFLNETKLEGTTTLSSLPEACTHLFDRWKKTKKQQKNISDDQIDRIKESAESIPGTPFKVIIGKTKTDGNATAGALIEEPGFIVHIYDGKKITSAVSENVPLDLREGIASEIGKLLGGSGGGRPKMTQSGGPHHNNVDKALAKAKELTIIYLKKE